MRGRKWRLWVLLSAPLLALSGALMVLAQLRPVTITLREESCPSVFDCSIQRLSTELPRHPWAPIICIRQFQNQADPDGLALIYDRREHQLIWSHAILIGTDDWVWDSIKEDDLTAVAQVPFSASNPMLPVFKALEKRGHVVRHEYNDKRNLYL